jgi:cation:H+ antiporter
MEAWLGLVAGLVLVVAGADALVRGAARAAAALGVPPLLVGLTVVAYGTSAPELAVSLSAGAGSRPELALANVVGSNVFNVLAILGLAALFAPLAASAAVVRREIPLMLLVTIGAMALGADGVLARGDGIVLLAGLAALTASQVVAARRALRGAAHARRARDANRPQVDPGRARRGRAGDTRRRDAFLRDALFVAAGLTGLVIGAGWLVDAAVAIALDLGVGEVVIGLTIVAAGTSLPELATSIVAALRGERDLAIGNVVGSNVFNLVGILGLASLTAPGGLPVASQVLGLDAWVALGAAALLLPLARSGGALVRWEGAVLVLAYAGYLAAVVAIALGRWDVPPVGVGVAIAGLPLLLAAGALARRPRAAHPR